MINHIMFASDFSVESLVLAKKVKAFAQTFDAKISLVHVIERPVTYAHLFSQAMDAMEEHKVHAQVILEAFCKHLEIPLENGHLLVGTAYTIIKALSKQLDVDLLMVGSQGTSGYWHALGSTAEKLIQMAPCPVLSLNAKNITQKQIKDELIYYAKKVPIAADYMESGLAHGKAIKSLKDSLPAKEQTPSLYGSKRGVGQEIRRGPKPTHRLPGTPYDPVIDDEESSDK